MADRRKTSILSRIAGIDLIIERLDALDGGQAAIVEQMTLANGRTRKLEDRETARYERERLATTAGAESRGKWRDYKAALLGAIAVGVVTQAPGILHLFGGG